MLITGTPVSEGVVPGRFGGRNSPSAGYAAFTPLFTLKSGIKGGQFWDGREPDLAGQARGPFLNPVEMNNTTRGQVIGKIEGRPYADLFEQECGPDAFLTENIDSSYVCMSEAIAAFEGTALFSPFTSKFDAVEGRTGQLYRTGRSRPEPCSPAGPSAAIATPPRSAAGGRCCSPTSSITTSACR